MASILGTAGNDILVGTTESDIINGFEGDDQITITLSPFPSTDTVDGGDGYDTLILPYNREYPNTFGYVEVAYTGDHYHASYVTNLGDFQSVDFTGIEILDLSGMGGDTSFFNYGGPEIKTVIGSYKTVLESYDLADDTILVSDFPAGPAGTITRHDGNGALTYELHFSNLNTFYTGPGNDYFMIDTSNVNFSLYVCRVGLGQGNDVASLGNVDDSAFGNEGVDQIYGMNGDDFISGGSGGDLLYGGDGVDSIYGDEDNDQIFGDSGNDFICGGAGNDNLYGGDGADEIYDFSYSVEPSAAFENDYIAGGAGNDAIHLSGGVDRIYFGSKSDGVDKIYGFTGHTFLTNVRDDQILIENAGFRAIMPEGQLNAANLLVFRTSADRQDGNDYFIYRVSDHSLWFDADAQRPGAAVPICQFMNDPLLGADNIFIV